MSNLFELRPAREDDLPYLNSYCYSEGMDNLPGIENVTVAVNGEDIPVGFIRIAFGADGTAHVNPVVTVSTWRGYGVGKALTLQALKKYGELRLVSRGTSHDFYRALGFEDVPWESIDTAVTEDCDGCPLYDECNPRPMAKELS